MKRKLLGIFIFLIVCIIMIQTLSNAEAGKLSVKLSYPRYLMHEQEYFDAYAMNTGQNHPIFQLIAVSNDNEDQIIGTNYYCLNAKVGETWTTTSAVGKKVEYDTCYDLIKDKTIIDAMSETEYNGVVKNEYYDNLMWVIDNLYIPNGNNENDKL